jgi:uncharacterized protein YrrD
MPDPVSWFVIEPGWTVAAADGRDVGKVREVLGDPNADIFDGLAVDPGLLRGARYVPAEQVASIYEGRVELAMGEDQFEQLEEYAEQPG